MKIALRPDYEPERNADDTLAEYWRKVLHYKDEVEKLLHATDLAENLEW